MLIFRARASVKCYSSSVIAFRNPPGQEGSAVARRCVYSLPCKLRAPTLHCAATSLAQGNTSVDGSSGIAKVQTDSDIDDRQPSSRRNAVHDTYNLSSSNGFYDDTGSSSGKARAINGTHHPLEPPHASESGIGDDDQYHVSSMSASSAKDRLKQDLDRERSLTSSSRAEATDGTSASEASLSTQPAASSLESPSDTSSMPGEEWHPRQERLKRLREGQDGSLDDKERLRRLRISMANKGRQPWNTGRKHSPGEAAPFLARPTECTIWLPAFWAAPLEPPCFKH